LKVCAARKLKNPVPNAAAEKWGKKISTTDEVDKAERELWRQAYITLHPLSERRK